MSEETADKPSKDVIGLRGILRPHHPVVGLALTAPIFVIYHLGILFLDIRNGVDFITRYVLQLLDANLMAYIAVTVVVAAGLIGGAIYVRKTNDKDTRGVVATVGMVILESLVLALLMTFTVGWATQTIIPWQVGGEPMGAFAKLVMSCGAGFHEELIFRVILFGGLAFVATRLPFGSLFGVIGTAVFAALLFSGVHYVGSLADDFTVTSFIFRFIAGLYLTAVYRLRGFAVAVYTHTIYDLLVFFVYT